MSEEFEWLNPPSSVESTGTAVKLTTGDCTDFWRKTHYGFVRDDGHFYYRWISGDFTVTTTFEGSYRELYDQAGIMLRIDERNWIKAGIEYTDGFQHFSVVATRDHSDWSVTRLEEAPVKLTMRATKHGEAIRIQYRASDGNWRMARLAYLPPAEKIMVGIMACSPKRKGFEVRFDEIEIGAPISRELHD